jgi:hypothetical protein
MINIVFGGEGGTILAVDISIFNKWPPTMLNMYAFYKKSTYIIYMIEVVHREEQAQVFFGLRQRKLRSAWEILCRFLQNSFVSWKSCFFDSLGAFSAIFFEKIIFEIIQLNM